MKTLNRITLIGNLGQDPEVAKFENGTDVINFNLATSSYIGKDENGESKYITQWHRVVGYGFLVAPIQQYVKKGNTLYIEGELRHRSYENKHGQTVYVSEILMNDFKLMSNGLK